MKVLEGSPLRATIHLNWTKERLLYLGMERKSKNSKVLDEFKRGAVKKLDAYRQLKVMHETTSADMSAASIN